MSTNSDLAFDTGKRSPKLLTNTFPRRACRRWSIWP